MAPFWHSVLLLALPSSVFAITLDCESIRDDGVNWNLKALGGVKTVHDRHHTAPTYHNMTFSVDICNALEKNPDFSDQDQCPQGSRICAQEQAWRNGVAESVDKIIPIAGQFTFDGGEDMDPIPKRLKGSSSHEDAEREGLRLTLKGPKYDGKKQRAIIEFICDRNVTGNEGFENTESKSSRRASEEGGEGGEGGEGDGGDNEPELDQGQSLTFVSYHEEQEGTETLRLKWLTKYACEDAAGKKPDTPSSGSGGSSSGWGFFTWFIIILFLLAATYIIFGSWLNYNRYGARGWDLIPHGDAVRDLPYTLKDFFGNLVGRFQGGGSRGGYSAV